MYRGKHNKRSCRRSGKSIALLVSLLLIVTVAVGGTIAFLLDGTGPLQNLFNPSKVTTEVKETFDGTEKENVKIKNTGDTEAWIRAAVIINWQDQGGEIYGDNLPVGGPEDVEGIDYVIKYDLNSGWVKGDDDFYYWTSPVAPGAETGVLITSCYPKENVTEGYNLYNLNVEIIGSGIQSKPAEAFNEAWAASSGLTVDTTNWKLVEVGGQ